MRLSRRRTGSWAQLKDNACETHNANDWPRTNPTRKSGVGTRRQIAAIGWERARLPPWSDESARRTVIEVGTKPKSRFMAFTSMLSGSVRPWEVFLHRQASFFRCPATGIRSYWAGSLELSTGRLAGEGVKTVLDLELRDSGNDLSPCNQTEI